MSLSDKLQEKLDRLVDFLSNEKVLVAFSGGVDSSLLAFLTNKYAKKKIAILINTIFITDEEIEDAKKFVKKYNIPFETLQLNPLENQEIAKNSPNRCYICKLALYEHLISFKKKNNFNMIIDGTNLDDLGDFRPGYKALKELNITTPYIKFKISKEEIRNISQYLELETASKPSMACLASRIPYGEEINKNQIIMIDKAEKFLKSYLEFSQLRVRFHNNNLARIEIYQEEFDKIFDKKAIQKINQKLKEIGFTYITLDLAGFRSGSMNESIKNI